MKRLLLAGFTALMILGAAPRARAEVPGVTPFDVAYFAYRGYFTAQGIPSYNRLQDDYRRQAITADEILQAAIATKRVSAEALNDAGYRRALRLQLRLLLLDNGS